MGISSDSLLPFFLEERFCQNTSFVLNGYFISQKGFSMMGGIYFGILVGKGISIMGSSGHFIIGGCCRIKGSEDCLIAAIYSCVFVRSNDYVLASYSYTSITASLSFNKKMICQHYWRSSGVSASFKPNFRITWTLLNYLITQGVNCKRRSFAGLRQWLLIIPLIYKIIISLWMPLQLINGMGEGTTGSQP